MTRSKQTFLAGFEDEGDGEGAGPKLAGRSVYVVDSHSLIFQVFHALTDMSSPAGQPVAAIHGFIQDVAILLERRKPDYLFCAFDKTERTFRHDFFEQYKAHREPMPEDLRWQMPQIQRFLEALGVPVLELENFEADDILATVALQCESAGARCYLVTADKDCRQLITDRTAVYNIRKDEVIDPLVVREEWGIRPDQVIDFQALCGDPVDNVPGVPGVGPKGAGALLARYESLEGIFDSLPDVKVPGLGPKRIQSLAEAQEQVLLSRRLVRLDPHVPIEIPWEAGRTGSVDVPEVRALCREFGFRQLTERLVGLAVAEPPETWQTNYVLIDDLEQLQAKVQEWSQLPRVAFDIETTSEHPRLAEIVGFSLAWAPGEACYIPVRGPGESRCLDTEDVLRTLSPILTSAEVELVGQNLKYDLVVLRTHGAAVEGRAFDCMVADYLLDAGQRNHGLADLARRYLHHDVISIQELLGRGRRQKRMDHVPVDEVVPYAAEDVDVPLRLSEILERRLGEEDLLDLFRDLEMPLIEVLAELEFNGIRIDVARLEELGRKFSSRMADLEVEIHELAGGPFNIDSPQQLATVLFETLQLPVVKKTKTGASTDVDVLKRLAERHPLPARVIEYRQYAKLKGTYVDALPLLVHPETRRIHSSFKQDVAATGRISSTDPNLQNIPVRTEEGRAIRSAFLPAEGWQLLAADYSQIELRVLAHFSGDEALRRAFFEDRDIHRQVAGEIYGVPLDEVTDEMRRNAKAINFGIIYGQSPFGLARALDIDKSEAAEFIDAYFDGYPGVEAFLDNVLADCHAQGYVQTALGRKRTVQGVRSSERRGATRQRTLPERIAINTVIQGTAADLIKLAMIRIHRKMREESPPARMILQIHDELIFEVDPAHADPFAEMVVEEMGGVGDLDVPLKIDVKVGGNWSECEPV